MVVWCGAGVHVPALGTAVVTACCVCSVDGAVTGVTPSMEMPSGAVVVVCSAVSVGVVGNNSTAVLIAVVVTEGIAAVVMAGTSVGAVVVAVDMTVSVGAMVASGAAHRSRCMLGDWMA